MRSGRMRPEEAVLLLEDRGTTLQSAVLQSEPVEQMSPPATRLHMQLAAKWNDDCGVIAVVVVETSGHRMILTVTAKAFLSYASRDNFIYYECKIKSILHK